MWKEAWREHVRSMCKAYSERDERLHNVVVAAQRGLRESRTNGETFRPRPSPSLPLPPLASGLLFHPLAAAIEWPGITPIYGVSRAQATIVGRDCANESLKGACSRCSRIRPPWKARLGSRGGFSRSLHNFSVFRSHIPSQQYNSSSSTEEQDASGRARCSAACPKLSACGTAK